MNENEESDASHAELTLNLWAKKNFVALFMKANGVAFDKSAKMTWLRNRS